MSGITSKTGVCNLALGHLGNYGTVSNIDTPTNDKERTFALWYDITRQKLLKSVMPNFALGRKLVSELVVTIPFGYAHAFEYPTDCLKVLGLGEVADRYLYEYSVEGRAIFTDDEWEDGLQLRYVKDITDVNTMSPEFKMLFSLELAYNTAIAITQSAEKKMAIAKLLPGEKSEASGLNAQENKPIRVSYSKFKAARSSDQSRNPVKR